MVNGNVTFTSAINHGKQSNSSGQGSAGKGLESMGFNLPELKWPSSLVEVASSEEESSASAAAGKKRGTGKLQKKKTKTKQSSSEEDSDDEDSISSTESRGKRKADSSRPNHAIARTEAGTP